jgi:hypothetical protein
VGDGSLVILVKDSQIKEKCGTPRCRDATGSSFVAKVRGEVFAHVHAVAVRRHRSMWN